MRQLVALVLLALVSACGTASETGTDGPESGAPPTEWRTEYWRDMQVDVPADWGYGGAPMPGGGAERVACYAIAMVTATGEQSSGGDRTEPYVGRPIGLTDVCQIYPFIGPDAEPPQAPSVWLGADVEPGTVDRGDGWTQQTVEVNGSTLTVTTDDAALRKRILESATGGETCFSELDTTAPLPGEEPDPAAGAAVAMTVCAYGDDEAGSGEAGLRYATTLGQAAVEEYVDAVRRGDEAKDQCPTLDVAESNWVVLELADRGGAIVRRDVVHLVCPGVEVGASSPGGLETVALTADMVRPWAANGIPAVVHGPGTTPGPLAEFFIGPQG